MSPANSLVQRLRDVLVWLTRERPGEGWGMYLEEAAVEWSSVVVSGASQGGKTATLLSRDREVSRAVLFNAFGSAIRGADGTPELADWSLAPRATPAARVFGLWHAEEAANTYGPLLLQAMGVDAYGETTDVDEMTPPYGCSHMLRTRVLPSTARNDTDFSDAHPSVGADYATPFDADGVPVLAPTWIYMMTAPIPTSP